MAFTNLIKNEIRKVKSGNLGWRQIDVSCDGQIGIVFGPDRIGSCENGSSRIKSGNDAGLGNGNGLLFLEERV